MPFACRSVVILVLSALFAASCYSTQGLPAQGLTSLRRGDQSREIVLSAGQQGRVRIRPASLVRFHRVDGATTDWTQAENVRLSPELIVIARGAQAAQVLRWTDVNGLEVNDLDVGQTIVGVVGGTTLVLVAAATEAIVIGALASLRIRVDEIGLTRAAMDSVVGAAGRHLDEDESAAHVRPEENDASPEAVLASRPLFSTEARRRDLVRGSLAIDSGVEFGPLKLRSQVGVMGSLRIANLLELGVGIGMVDMGTLGMGPSAVGSISATAAPDSPLAERVRVVGRGRVGVHLDLDAARRVGLFIGQEVGISSGGWVDARTVWGVRFRVLDRLQLGVLPLNPRVTWPSADALSLTAYASSVELAWVL